MNLLSLEIDNFRNIKYLRIPFPNKVTVLTGKNGQGKTSLLESIYILSQAKSFRSSRPSELVNWDYLEGDADCRVTGKISNIDGEREVSYTVKSGRKKVLVNGERVLSSSAFYGNLRCVEFTPDDLFLISGSPALRRRFFDRLISQIDSKYFDNLIAYHRALKHRNKMIVEGVSKYKELLPWDSILADKGTELSIKRKEVLEEYKEFFSLNYNYFTGYKSVSGNIENANISYKSNFLSEDSEIISKSDILELFESRFTKDLSRRSTFYGIHRDEFEITLNTGSGNRMAKLAASQGQKRSLSLSLKFSAVSLIEKLTNESAILLLDDVESELDRYRRQALYWKIRDISSQVIITATEISDSGFEDLSSPMVYHIESGKIESP